MNNYLSLNILFLILFAGCQNTNEKYQDFSNLNWICDTTLVADLKEFTTDSAFITNKKYSHCNCYSKSVLVKSGYFREHPTKNIRIPIGLIKYYDSLENIIMEEEYLITDDGPTTLNSVYSFSSNGDTIKTESSFVKIVALNDTINVGDTIEIFISLPASLWNENVAIYYFDIPEDDDNYLRQYPTYRDSKDKLTLYKRVATKPGIAHVSGFVSDVSLDDTLVTKDINSKFISYYERNIYFDHEIFVRE